MQYWLMKTEPESWSWQQQLSKTDAHGNWLAEGWDGVRNYQAANFMKEMQVGDLAFFYHTGKAREIVGIVEICETYHPDPTDLKGRFGMVSVKAFKSLRRAVTLEEIKDHPDLQMLPLIKQPRLSVMPIPQECWNIILKISGTSFVV